MEIGRVWRDLTATNGPAHQKASDPNPRSLFLVVRR